MKTDKFGQIILSASEAFSGIYSGKIVDLSLINLDAAEEITLYTLAQRDNADNIPNLTQFEEEEIDLKLFDKSNQCDWFMPENYCPDLVEHLYSLCKTVQERDRVDQELKLFIQHSMFDLLFYLKYLVDTMREHGIVWGVGRGSSVASFVLYLLGIHKINSIAYDLDIHEFLKENSDGI